MKAFILVLLLGTSWAFAQETNGNYIVVVETNIHPKKVARDLGLGVKKHWTNAVNGFSGYYTSNEVTRIKKHSNVKFVEPDVEVTTCAQTVPTGVRRIGCTNNAAWLASSTTPIDVDIAIIDTGVDLTHPDLNVYASTNFSAELTANDGGGHGTHCAGIAAAKNNTLGVVGVAPGARLWAVKVLDDDGSGPLSAIIGGVDYVYQHASEIEVASMSLGGRGSFLSLRSAIQACVSKGVVFVVAAGNSGIDVYGGDNIFGTSDDFYPAAFPEVLTVSALGDSDGISGGLGPDLLDSIGAVYCKDDTMAGFSNYSTEVVSDNPVSSPGLAVDVAAPGVNIYSTYKGGTYATMSGTSMACPHVSGVVGLYIAQYGRATTASGVYAIRQAIIDCAEPQAGWGRNPTNPHPYFDFYPEGLVRVDRFGVAPDWPDVRITSPVGSPPDCPSFAATNSIIFAARAFDSTDGDISSNLVWKRWDTGAVIGTGPVVTNISVIPGTQSYSASVTNSAGRVGADYTCVTRTNVAFTGPVVTINYPTNGQTFPDTSSGHYPAIGGTAICPVSGDISYKLRWSSSLDGGLFVGASGVHYLRSGTHVITAAVQSPTTLLNGSTNITITIGGTPPPTTNHPPIVAINYPSEGESFAEGSSVTVSSTASDTEDGDLTSSIRVNDNINGAIGTGGSVLFFPSVGSHTLTAFVADSAGAVASASRSFSVYARQTNAPPTIYITAPANGLTVISNTAVVFSAVAQDDADGTISTNIVWKNSLSGTMETGASLTNTLTTTGTNLITATITDSGSLSTSANVSVIVTNALPANAWPVVIITAPTNGLVVTTGTSVSYAGTATDTEDGALVVKWVDSVAGLLGTGASGSYTPALGTHRLTASAVDSAGATSSTNVLIQVNNANTLPTQLNVTLYTTRSSYPSKTAVSTYARVQSAGTNVPNATCFFYAVGANGVTKYFNPSSATSASTGVTPSVKITKPGTNLGLGTATIYCDATATGYLSAKTNKTVTITAR